MRGLFTIPTAKNLRERTRPLLRSAVVALMAYLAGYLMVRFSNTKYWFDKNTEETGSYTFFDTWSHTDTLLHRAYYPMLALDSAVFGRPFVRDKF
jgi:hypothetical protein